MGPPGGSPYDEDSFAKGELRADLCELVRQFCLEHSTKVVDALMSNFDVRRRSMKEIRTLP